MTRTSYNNGALVASVIKRLIKDPDLKAVFIYNTDYEYMSSILPAIADHLENDVLTYAYQRKEIRTPVGDGNIRFVNSVEKTCGSMYNIVYLSALADLKPHDVQYLNNSCYDSNK